MEFDEEKLKSELAQSAAKLDGEPVPAPDFFALRAMVERQQAAARRAQRRQLALFTVVAALLISAIIVLTGVSGVFFLALQAAAFAGAAVGLAVYFARARRPAQGAAR